MSSCFVPCFADRLMWANLIDKRSPDGLGIARQSSIFWMARKADPLFAAALIRRLRGPRGAGDVSQQLYTAVVAQARQPVFYLDYGVPDTQTGRFEMICLHMFLLLRRLKELGPRGRALGQDIHDAMFVDMDRTFREAGVGDMGVGKRVKKLAASLYGRIAAYDDGLARDEAALTAALRRNLYATVLDDDGRPPAGTGGPTNAQLDEMAAYIRLAAQAMDAADGVAMIGGDVQFPAIGSSPP